MKVLVKGRKGCIHWEHIEDEGDGHEIGRCLFCPLVKDYTDGYPESTPLIYVPNLVTVYFEQLKSR